jgi:tetratricopeptide (TPR) repeat protein
LLFGNEKVYTNPSKSDIVEIQFKNGPRNWHWYEKRIFQSHNELIKALQTPTFIQITEGINKDIGKIISTSSALKNRIDRTLAQPSELSDTAKLFQLLFQYFLGKGSTISDDLKSLANNTSNESQIRAIALNILADHYLSRNRLDKAVAAAEESLKLEPNQIAAFYLASNAYKLNGLYEESFNRINQISSDLSTSLMIDIKMDKVTCLLLQLKASDQINNAEHSYKIASTLFSTLIQDGHFDASNIDLIDRLIIDSIGYEKLKDARLFLNYRLQQMLNAKEPEQIWFKIDELMSFFIEKHDYEFAISIYEQFLRLNIQPHLSRRRLVALLIKTNRLNEARELSIDSKAFFT